MIDWRPRVIHALAALNLAIMRWIARDHPAVVEVREGMNNTIRNLEAGRPPDYVEPLAGINAAVLLAAFNATTTDPEHQARLNACLEALRSTKILEAGTMMLGGLMAAGYPPEECMARVMANSVALGIVTEKRLRDAQSLMTS